MKTPESNIYRYPRSFEIIDPNLVILETTIRKVSLGGELKIIDTMHGLHVSTHAYLSGVFKGEPIVRSYCAISFDHDYIMRELQKDLLNKIERYFI